MSFIFANKSARALCTGFFVLALAGADSGAAAAKAASGQRKRPTMRGQGGKQKHDKYQPDVDFSITDKSSSGSWYLDADVNFKSKEKKSGQKGGEFSQHKSTRGPNTYKKQSTFKEDTTKTRDQTVVKHEGDFKKDKDIHNSQKELDLHYYVEGVERADDESGTAIKILGKLWGLLSDCRRRLSKTLGFI